jgi:hypothetical protein
MRASSILFMACKSKSSIWCNSACATGGSSSPWRLPWILELDPNMLALKQDIVEWVNLWNHRTSPLTYQCSFLFSRTVNCASVAAQQK